MIIWCFTCFGIFTFLACLVYTISDEEYLHQFTKWAEDNGYIYKTFQNWYSALQFNNKNTRQEFKIDIQLKKVNYEYFPYLDTFKFLDLDTMTISNYCTDPDNSDRYKCLSSPNGGWESANYLRLDEVSREYCHSCDLTQVMDSNGNQIWTSTGNCNWSYTYDRWLLISESNYSDDLEDYIFSDDSKNDTDKIEERKKFIDERIKKEENYKKSTQEFVTVYDSDTYLGEYGII